MNATCLNAIRPNETRPNETRPNETRRAGLLLALGDARVVEAYWPGTSVSATGHFGSVESSPQSWSTAGLTPNLLISGNLVAEVGRCRSHTAVEA